MWTQKTVIDVCFLSQFLIRDRLENAQQERNTVRLA